MTKEFVPYELALKMKQLGYKKEGVDEDCFAFYDEEEYLFTVREQDDIDEEWLIAPTFSQAFRWFREKYKLFHRTQSVDEFRQDVWWECVVYGKTENKRDIRCQPEETYEEAETACLEKLIEIVESNKSE
jgi:hypothetical protein